MINRILTTVLAAGLVFSVAGSAAFAATMPKTKAACEKMKSMKWDDTASKCMKGK